MLTRYSLPLHRAPLFLKTFFSPCLLLQIVAAIVLSFQVLKFPVLWLHGPFSVCSTSSTPFLLFHSLFCNQEKSGPLYLFHNVFSVWVMDGQKGKKVTFWCWLLKCLFLQMTEKSVSHRCLCVPKIFWLAAVPGKCRAVIMVAFTIVCLHVMHQTWSPAGEALGIRPVVTFEEDVHSYILLLILFCD